MHQLRYKLQPALKIMSPLKTSYNIVELPKGKSTFPGNLLDDILACIIEIISFEFSIFILRINLEVKLISFEMI